MTHWPIVRDAVLALLRSYNGGTVYTTKNSGRNDWTVRGAGNESAVVQKYQRSQFGYNLLGRMQMGHRQELHYPRITLLVKIGQANPEKAAHAVEDRVTQIIEHFDKYLRLKGAEGVTRAEVVAEGVPELIGSRNSDKSTHAACSIDFIVACSYEMNPIEAGH